MQWMVVIALASCVKMMCSQDVNFLSSDYLSVWDVCYDPWYIWYQTNQSSLQKNLLHLQCDRTFWDETSPQHCSDINLYAQSSRNHSFIYGTFEFVAKLPIGGYSSGSLDLISINCPLYPCSGSIKGHIAGFSFWQVSSDRVSCYLYYVDAKSEDRVWLEIRSYTWPATVNITSPHSFRFVWTPKYFACLIDGIVVANFTNQLAVPKERFLPKFQLSCDEASKNRTAADGYQLDLVSVTYSKPSDRDVWNKSQVQHEAPVATWKEHWEEHVQLLTLYAYDDNVALYFDELVSKKLGNDESPVNGWLFEYVGQVWRYADQQFGPLYQGNDSRFYAIFHVGRYDGCHLATQMDDSHDYRHVLDCGHTERTYWNTNTLSARTNNACWAAAYITLLFAKGVYRNPMYLIDQLALQDLLQYDICLGADDTEVAQLVFDHVVANPQTTPRANSYWLRDFYLPIYKSYGQSEVLKNYFNVLSTNFPSFVDEDSIKKYDSLNVTLGMCVHFWSGAANTSLKYLAAKAFGWTVKDSLDFRQARKDFPNIHYAGEYDGMLQDFTLQLPVTVDNTTRSSQNSTYLLQTALGVCIPVAIVVLASSAVAFRWCKKKKQRQRIPPLALRSLTPRSQYEGNARLANTGNAANKGKNYGFLVGNDVKPFVIPRRKLQQSSVVLGKGEFGTVYAATASGLHGLVGTVSVAAKVLSMRYRHDDAEQRILFEKEVRVMINAGQHLNLVNLLGIVLGDRPTLILELCELGSLLSRLTNCRLNPETFVDLLDEEGNIRKETLVASSLQTQKLISAPAPQTAVDDESPYVIKAPLPEILTTHNLLDFSYQVCRGLEFLSLKSIVHRDIAARNVLLTKDNIAKVSDFGMARLYEKNYVQDATGQSAPLPVRWMAPEAITSLSFNESTDVWSYGVLLWEIFSLGLLPYAHITLNNRVAQFGEWLAAGNHLDKPVLSPNNIFEVMRSCWTVATLERPSFQELRLNLEEILSADIAGYYTKMDEPYHRYNLDAAHLSELADVGKSEALHRSGKIDHGPDLP